GDDEGDTEEFKVNKTRESRKMTKEIKKTQQHVPNDSKPNITIEQTTIDEEIITTTTKETNNSNSGELEIKFKPLQIVGNKPSAISFTSTNTDLQRLRKEMKVLNGQEADGADLDDIEGIFEGDDNDEDINELDDTQRSVKLMLRSKLFCF
ncbi:unnamed protein product, partial [Adineta steineri]